MRNFLIDGNQISELNELVEDLPSQGYHWLSFTRREFEVELAHIQKMLAKIYNFEVLEFHLNDLFDNQLSSHYDFTTEYDVIVFRRLARGRSETDPSNPGQILHTASTSGGPPILRRIDTSPIGFLVIDKLIITVHPADCSVRDLVVNKLLSTATSSTFSHSSGRLPTNPTELMLRIIGIVVDGYLDLRKELTRQLDHWQSELINPNARFNNWSALFDSRLTLHYLDEVCEDQRAAIQDWIEALESWLETDSLSKTELELIKVRSRDILEHIERVMHHVGRLEQSAETVVQMHFNIQSNRNNDMMKTLTTLIAIFLPLNLITGFFGMNFEKFPFLKQEEGLLLTEIFMAFLAIVLGGYFWLNRYLTVSKTKTKS